jgi:hypothetical protein
MVGPILGDPIGVDRFWGWHLRARCCPCIIECIASASTCNFSAVKICCIKTWAKIVRFLYSEHLIYGLLVCTCVFLLRQESFDMILVNNPSFYDGVLHWERSVAANWRRRAVPWLRQWQSSCWHASRAGTTKSRYIQWRKRTSWRWRRLQRLAFRRLPSSWLDGSSVRLKTCRTPYFCL